jgi:hypothetical protein
LRLQVSGGNGEQVMSRDVHRLCTQLDFFRLLAFYHSGAPRQPGGSTLHTQCQPASAGQAIAVCRPRQLAARRANVLLLSILSSLSGCGFFINTALVMLSVYVNIWVILLMGLSVNEGEWVGWKRCGWMGLAASELARVPVLEGRTGQLGITIQTSCFTMASCLSSWLATLCGSASLPQASWRLTPALLQTIR